MTLALVALSVAGLVGCVLARWSGRAAGWLGTRRAVPVLTAGALAVALATGFGLTVLAAAVLATAAPVAAVGGWSATTIASLLPVPTVIGLCAGVVVGMLLLRSVLKVGRILAVLVRAELAGRRLRTGRGPIVIVDDGSADAYTLAGLRGCVVLSSRLWDRLADSERAMVLSHELSHLRHRHHLYLHGVDLAVAANPLLRQVADTVRLGIERWADEDAALSLGDRRAAARALAGTALLRSRLNKVPLPQSALGAATGQVSVRAAALLAPTAPAPARRSVALTAALAAVFALGAASVLVLHHDLETAQRLLHTAR